MIKSKSNYLKQCLVPSWFLWFFPHHTDNWCPTVRAIHSVCHNQFQNENVYDLLLWLLLWLCPVYLSDMYCKQRRHWWLPLTGNVSAINIKSTLKQITHNSYLSPVIYHWSYVILNMPNTNDRLQFLLKLRMQQLSCF